MSEESRRTHVPGKVFFLRQCWPGLTWMVVSIDSEQGRRLRERGETVYETPAQAYAVARRLNLSRKNGGDLFS